MFASPRISGQSRWAQQPQAPGGPHYVISALNSSGIAAFSATRCWRAFFRVRAIPTPTKRCGAIFRRCGTRNFSKTFAWKWKTIPNQPNGKIVVFYVTERPIIRRIEYKGNKSITESDILDAFKDKKVGLSVESQFDPTKIKRAEVVIKGLLAAHGHQFATVKPTYERIAATNAVKLVFNIDEGPKVKVGNDHDRGEQGLLEPRESSARCATTGPTRSRSVSRTFR